MDHSETAPHGANTDSTVRLAALEQRVDAAHMGRDARRSGLMSGLALLLSIVSTLVSLVNSYQTRIHETQRELRDVIKTMNELIRHNMAEQRDTSIPEVQRRTLAVINNAENKIHLVDAQRLVTTLTTGPFSKILGIPISASELTNLGANMQQSSLFAEAADMYRLSQGIARNGSELAIAHTNLGDLIAGGMLDFDGADLASRREKWRRQYSAALSAFDTFKTDSSGTMQYQKALTENQWAKAEKFNGDCAEARRHWAEALRWLGESGARLLDKSIPLSPQINASDAAAKLQC